MALPEQPLILLTGATGYVGGRMRRRLEQRGLRLRLLARRPEALRGRVDASTELVAGNVLERETLGAALAGVHTAYYLIHSMGGGSDFEERDREAARNFAQAAREAGVKRIIYLGGLGPDTGDLSPHLRSRHEVGRILREEGVPTIEFRASIVLGSGSLSFEMVRALVERLPVMITPQWTTVEAQPIAIRDLLAYLLAALELPVGESRVYEIGGRDRASYEEIMRTYARHRGLTRRMIRVPVISPQLSSKWLGLITPIYARIGKHLIESIKHPTVVTDGAAARDFGIEPMGLDEAIALALYREEIRFVESRWYDALSSGGEGQTWAGDRFGNRLVDRREIFIPLPPDEAFAPVQRIGGKNGWYALDLLWQLRGFLDLLVGGVGVRRGRPHPVELYVGDALDFWRVEAIEPGKRLRLRAEMRLPGRAWLEFETQASQGGTRLQQTALFDPVGLGGLAYWWSVYPLHGLVFGGMLRGIRRRALRIARDGGS